MAITIKQEPQQFTPVFNPMTYVASSDQSSSYDFFFLNVYTKDESSADISLLRIPPRYDNELMKFDLARSLEKYCYQDITGINDLTYGVRQVNNVYKKYSVYLVEEYGDVASGLSSGDTTTSDEVYAFNGCFHDEDFQDYDFTHYVVSGSSTDCKLLTDMRGANIPIKTTDSFEIGWMTSGGVTAPSKRVTIKTYDSSGSILGTYKIDNPYASGSTDAEKFLGCLVGAADLNNTTLSSGSQPVITDSVDTYAVYVENNTTIRVSEILYFKIDRSCYRASSGIRLFWVNSLGRIDAFNFNFQSERSQNTERASFRKQRGRFEGSSFVTDTHQHGKTNFYTKTTRKLKVRSGYLNDTEAVWLENLADSPAIWALIDGTLIPMVMDTNSYNRQTIERNRLFTVDFDLSYSIDDYRQRL